jgi:fluoroquinolone transport system permease protein
VFSFSHNRVEGLAMAKLSGLFMLGLPVPFFLMSKVQYWFSFLPSYWIAKLGVEQNYIYSVPALLSSIIWMSILYRKFDRKLI